MGQLEDNRLEDENMMARIAVFQQLHDLAKDSQDSGFRKSVFDVLCAYVRNMTSAKSYREGVGKDNPTKECQELLNILFHRLDEFDGYGELTANLQGAHLKGADFLEAHLPNAMFVSTNCENATFAGAYLGSANFSNANFANADLSESYMHVANLKGTNFAGAIFHRVDFTEECFFEVYSIEGANFCGAEIDKDQLPCDKGKYIADWTSDEFWEAIEKEIKGYTT